MTLNDRVEERYRVDYRSDEDPGSNDETGPWYEYVSDKTEDHARECLNIGTRGFAKSIHFRLVKETRVIYSQVIEIQRGTL